MKKRNFNVPESASPEDKFRSINLTKGTETDVLKLVKLAETYKFEPVLYFEPDLAENSTYEKDLSDFAADGEFNRPFVNAAKFIEFGKKEDPTFEGRLTEFPLMVTVHSFGERETADGSKSLYIKCLMPFLDEFDVNKEPGPYVQ